MTYEELKNEVFDALKNKPDWSRKGQFVFNYIEEKYGPVAREVQFIKHVDCFYDDTQINAFIAESCALINQYDEL